MSRAPRQVREERLERFIRQREFALSNIERIQDLLDRIRAVEGIEKDVEALRHHIAVRLNLESNLSDAQALVLRMEKAIEREREWLARYDEEQALDADSASVDQDAESSAIQQAASIHEAEELLRITDENRQAAGIEPFERGLLKLGANRVDDLTLDEVDAIARQYLNTPNPTGRADVPPIRNTLARAVIFLDERLASLRQAADSIRKEQSHRR